MKKMNLNLLVLTSLAIAAAPLAAHANKTTVTKVGNGDEGSDLEGATELSKGPIVEARKEAISLLKSVNTAGVAGLGALLPELENSKLYLTKKDSLTLESTDQGAFHADMKGRVYARTFAEAHAATRFFPVAEKLDGDQLVALHVHEALHRSLPPSVRENESVVSNLTLAITTPGASFDSVNRAAEKAMPAEFRKQQSADSSDRYAVPETARVKNPSELSYSYRAYKDPKTPTQFQVDSMHVIRSDLYPFGSDENPVGIGIEAGLIQRPSGSLMGPLSLSGRWRFWSARGFDIGVWGVVSMNTLSAEELKNSQYGRDTLTVGLSMKKDIEMFSIENFVGYTADGESKQRIGNIDYTYGYGSVISASTHPAMLIGPFRVGGFLEMNLGDYYRVKGGAFTYDPGRYRIVSGGPEIQYHRGNFSVGLTGRFLINATQDASFDSLGDLMGPGVAQGNVAATVSIYF